MEICSKLNRAKFSAVPAVSYGWRYALTQTCPVWCTGEFDGRSVMVLTAFGRDALATFARGLAWNQADSAESRAEILWGIDGGAVLSLRMGPLGQVRGDFVVYTEEKVPMTRLKGQLELDQSYLPQLAEQCRMLLRSDYTGD